MSNTTLQESLEEIKKYHDDTMNSIISGLEYTSKVKDRATGGYLRASKGELVEELARRLVVAAWTLNLNQDHARLRMNKTKFPIHVREEYLNKLAPESVRDYWIKRKNEMVYKFGTDVHVFIDNRFALPIECKAYTENAMIKRILVDAELLKEAKGVENYYLIQLESQLGGDYSQLNDVVYGSKSTHALASHFDINLEIITLLPGERKINEATHIEEFYKPLPIKSLQKAIETLSRGLSIYCKK